MLEHRGLVNSWSDAKRDGKELLSMFGNFLNKINQKEVSQMETDMNAQEILDSIDYELDDSEDYLSMGSEHLPTELTI